MALIDWIELSDDAEIIELSSDEENIQGYRDASPQSNSAQHQATLHDDQTMFIAEGDGREEDTESGNAEEATASSSVTEKESGNPEEATVSQTCPHAPTAGVTVKESGIPEEASKTCPHAPTAVTFPGPDSIPLKALTFEACVAKPRRRAKAKRRRKLHTDAPCTWRSPRLEDKHKGRRRNAVEEDAPCTWRSPRLEDKHKGRRRHAVEVAVDRKRSRMLEEEEEEEENTSARSRKKSKLLGEQCSLCR